MDVSCKEDNLAKPGRKSILILQVLLGLTLIVFLMWNLDLYQTWSRLKQADMGWLWLSCLSMILVYFSRSLIIIWIAWRRTTIGPLRLFVYNIMASFFSSFLPTRIGGDAVKGLYLSHYFPTMSEAYAAMILQRAAGIMGTFLVSIIAGFFVLPLKQSLILFCCAIVAFLGGLGLLVALSKFISKRKIESTPLEGGDAFVSKAGKVLVSFVLYSSRKKRLAAAVFFSMPITVLGILSAYCAARSVGSAMTFSDVLLASALSQLSAIITVTPGGVGVSESAFVAAALVLGIPRGESLPAIVLVRFVYTFISLLGGLIYLFNPLRLRRKATAPLGRKKNV